jgi:hypothetical protein
MLSLFLLFHFLQTMSLQFCCLSTFISGSQNPVSLLGFVLKIRKFHDICIPFKLGREHPVVFKVKC